MKNPLQSLHNHGQSVWGDHLRRRPITSGELMKHIEQHFSGSDAVRAVVIGMADGLTVPFAALSPSGRRTSFADWYRSRPAC